LHPIPKFYIVICLTKLKASAALACLALVRGDEWTTKPLEDRDPGGFEMTPLHGRIFAVFMFDELNK
jgi:hypothetical protein